MTISSISKKLMWIGIALIVVTGAIHLIDAPSSFGDATYKGLLFVANGIAGPADGAGGWVWSSLAGRWSAISLVG